MDRVSSMRKWLAALFLLIAIIMLVLGLTLFNQLRGYGFIVYWSACLLVTALAGMASLLDLLAIRRKSIQEQRELIEETLEELNREGKNKPNS